MKPRMTEMYGIWSCISPGIYGVGFTAEQAYKNWQERVALDIWKRPREKTQTRKTHQRFA